MTLIGPLSFLHRHGVRGRVVDPRLLPGLRPLEPDGQEGEEKHVDDHEAAKHEELTCL